MMAINRYRLRHAADQGHRGAILTLALLARTDKLLGVILLGNNLVNVAAATLATIISIRLFGESDLALSVATLLLTFLILVFSEVTPKVLGSSFPERIAYPAAYVLLPMLKLTCSSTCSCRASSRSCGSGNPSLEPARGWGSTSCARSSSNRRACCRANTSGCSSTCSNSTPRSQIEAVDIEDDPERLRQQIATSHHTRLVVHAGSPDNLLGVLHIRRVLHALVGADLDPETLRASLEEPYFVPAGTPLFTQLRNFQSGRRRLALVVDEYGELQGLQGLVTLEDLLEEMVGEFTTQAPSGMGYLRQEDDGSWLVEGSVLLRHLNRCSSSSRTSPKSA